VTGVQTCALPICSTPSNVREITASDYMRIIEETYADQD
jgi:hypothetical protein